MLSLIAIALVTTAALSLTNATPLAPRAPKAVPIILGGNKKSANLFSATSQQTEIVYQADDISLQLVTVHGPPTDFSRAGDPATILVAGRARPGTPLAIAEDGDAGQVSTHVFYLSNDNCDGGKGYYVQQLTKGPGAAEWEDGVAFRGAGICASKTSDALYAVGKVGGRQKGDVLRVGYVDAADNALGEAYYGHSGWVSVLY